MFCDKALWIGFPATLSGKRGFYPIMDLDNLIASQMENLIQQALNYTMICNATQEAGDVETWRVFIADVSGLFLAVLSAKGQLPARKDDNALSRDDLVIRFGEMKAHKHRAAGLSLSVLLILANGYRQGCVELIRREQSVEQSYKVRWEGLVERFFDSVELGVCLAWPAAEGGQRAPEAQEEETIGTYNEAWGLSKESQTERARNRATGGPKSARGEPAITPEESLTEQYQDFEESPGLELRTPAQREQARETHFPGESQAALEAINGISVVTASEQKERILVVDADPDALHELQSRLASLGYRVFVAHSAAQAFRQAKIARLDLIILDVFLPDADGFTVLEWLKMDRQTRDIPVVLISSLPDDGQWKSLGAAGYLSKPVLERDLLDCVARVLGMG